jgi:ankyrin repeat protein
VQYLGSQGARLGDVDTAQRSALHWAVEYGRGKVRQTPASTHKTSTPLTYPPQPSHTWHPLNSRLSVLPACLLCVQCVRALLQLGANPNAKDMKGFTVRPLLPSPSPT